jgi:type I restriction enzyme M protein
MVFTHEERKDDPAALTYHREDFVATTSNKQLNFLQHIVSLLGAKGRASVVVPDNVLFEGGAGETVRRHLLEHCDVHTLLRLPPGIFYAGSVKANVLFFERLPKKSRGKRSLWVYDLRTGSRFSLRNSPIGDVDLADFIKAYGGNRRRRTETTVFQRFDVDGLLESERCNLDIGIASAGGADELPAPSALAAEIIERLAAAAAAITAVEERLN